jgi:uncharacterized protein (UPF0276 family)
VGVGLRVPHYRTILADKPRIDFFEIISENFMVSGGSPLYHLERVLERYRVVQHGVSMSIGGPEAPSREYLTRLKALAKRVQTPWLSDHFCWCGAAGYNLHDLLPLPYTREAIELVAERARMVQDFLEVRFALENTSSYLSYRSSSMPEWEFVSEIAERADIGLMFDVNNVYVSAYNHGFDPYEFVRNVPHDRIVQIHLAGHTNLGKYIIDTHSGHVIDPVWDLYRETIELTGPVSTLIEWDDEIPEFAVVQAEAERARTVRDQALEARARPGQHQKAGGGVAPAPAIEPHPAEPRMWAQGGSRETASGHDEPAPGAT